MNDKSGFRLGDGWGHNQHTAFLFAVFPGMMQTQARSLKRASTAAASDLSGEEFPGELTLKAQSDDRDEARSLDTEPSHQQAVAQFLQKGVGRLHKCDPEQCEVNLLLALGHPWDWSSGEGKLARLNILLTLGHARILGQNPESAYQIFSVAYDLACELLQMDLFETAMRGKALAAQHMLDRPNLEQRAA